MYTQKLTESDFDKFKRKFKLKMKRQRRYYRTLCIIKKVLQKIYRLDSDYHPI